MDITVYNRLTTIHFLPCSSHLAGLSGRVSERPDPIDLNGLGLALNGTAECKRKSGFLCVCMSLVTFFNPVNKNDYILAFIKYITYYYCYINSETRFTSFISVINK